MFVNAGVQDAMGLRTPDALTPDFCKKNRFNDLQNGAHVFTRLRPCAV